MRKVFTRQKLDMTEGCIWRILVRFAFPLFLGGLFQQLYNAADAWVVGKYCGDNALSAVASSGSLCFLLIGFFQGVFMGASVIISRYFGAKDQENVDRTVHTTVVFALLLGAIMSVVGVVCTPTLLRWMGTPDEVMPNSVLYFRIYCSGLMALVLYNTCNGIFQALGDSTHPLMYLVISALVNVVLDFLFVAGFQWGVAGAAAATVLGQLLSACLGFAHLMSGKFTIQLKVSHLHLHWSILKRVIRIGIPSGIQNSVIAIANVVVQSNINVFGKLAMAGCGSYAKVEGFVFLPITSITMAMTTFIGQNLGAGQRERAKKGARVGTIMTVCFAELIGVAFFLLAPYLIGLFSDTPAVVACGVRQARVETLFYCFLALSHASAAVLRGSGRTIPPMVVMLSVWCVFRISYITLMVRWFQDITVVFTAYPVTWCISSILFAVILKCSHWAEKESRL